MISVTLTPMDVKERKWTRVEYERLVEAEILGPEDRVELLGGAMICKEPQHSLHAAAIRLVVRVLTRAFGPGWDVLGSRTSDEDYVALRKSLKKRPLDYFKQNFYADTAVFGGKPATKCGLEFFPLEKIVFASDCPFDPEGGTMYPRLTLEILDSLNIPKADREKIDYKNLEAVTGRKLVN